MPVLRCYVDDRTHAILERVARETGRTVEDLTEGAIENAAVGADVGNRAAGPASSRLPF